jgi:hypothetical protein
MPLKSGELKSAGRRLQKSALLSLSASSWLLVVAAVHFRNQGVGPINLLARNVRFAWGTRFRVEGKCRSKATINIRGV